MTRLVSGLIFSLILVVTSSSATADEVGDLIKQLKSDNPVMRMTAAQQLGQLGPDAAAAVQALAETLQDDNAMVRATSVHALGRIGDPAKKVVPAIAKLLGDENTMVQRESIQALGSISPGPEVSIPLISKALESADPNVRAHALHALANAAIKSDSAVDKLITALGTEEGRYWASLILHEMGPKAKKAAPHLAKLMSDKEPEVRMQALMALGAIGDHEASKEAIAKGLKDESSAVQYAATFAAGSMGAEAQALTGEIKTNAAGKDPFLQIVSSWALVKLNPDDEALKKTCYARLIEGIKSEDRSERHASAQGLLDLKPPFEQVGIPAVEAMLQHDDPEVLRNAIDALAAQGAAAVPRAIAALKHEKLRPIAAIVLARIGPEAKDAAPALIEALREEDDKEVRKELYFAIASIGPGCEGAVPHLIESLNDENLRARYGASFCLGRIGPNAKEAVPALTKNLQEDDAFLKLFSAWALVRIQPENDKLAKQVAPLFIMGLKNEDPVVRAEAASSLGLIGKAVGGNDIRAALNQAMQDREVVVRQAAQAALEQLRSEQ